MCKRTVIPALIIFLSVMAVSASYAVPLDPSGNVMNIYHYVVPFWQGGDSLASNGQGSVLQGWGCNKYAEKGIASPCYKKTEKGTFFASNTIGGKGCAITSLTMLFWYHGINFMPNAEGLLDPGKLDDWLVDNNGYESKDLLWWTPTGRFSIPVSWVRFSFTGAISTTTAYKFMVPNYCCDDYCIYKSYKCFMVEATSTNFAALLDKDTKAYAPGIMHMSGTDKEGGEHPSHFTVVGGYDKANSEYRDYDPNLKYDRSAQGYNKLYQPYKFIKLLRFKDYYSNFNTPLDKRIVYGTVHSPVEILLIDPQGRRTGYDPATGTNLVENPMSDYSVEDPISSTDPADPPGEPYKQLVVVYPSDGNYILQIFGTGDGPYTIDLMSKTYDGTINLDTSLTGTATSSLLQTYRISYSSTGEASLSQANQAPVANAGANQTGEQSYEVALDGSASYDPDGDPLTYTWSFISKPNNSGATLSDAHAVKPVFTPDLPGTYTLQLVLNDHFIDSAPSTVSITAAPVMSRISVAPNFSTPLTAGPGSISFDVNNIGRVGVSSGIITFSLTDPTGIVVSSGTQAFSLASGQSALIGIPVTLPPLKFGVYTLNYAQSDETKTGTPTTVVVPNSSLVVFSFDKTIYRVRDTVNVTLSLINTGKFNLDGATLTVTVPDTGYSNSISIGQGQTPPLQYAIPIPSNIIAGRHDVNATLTLLGGSSVMQNARIVLQDSTLALDMATSSQLVAGSTVVLTVENMGSVDTTYASQKLTLTDNYGNIVYQGNVSDSIMAGEKKILTDLQIPSQMSGRGALIEVILQDTKTGKLSYLTKSFTMSGLQAGLLAKTDKDVYMNTEAVKIVSTVTSSAINIENGTLEIKINRYKKPIGGEFTVFLPQNGVTACGNNNGQLYFPMAIAIAADGSVYVDDNNRILKFDSNGNFIKKWGSYGYGNGQFRSPWGLAVAVDGSVYVADTLNNRIQKFDSNGNFVTMWGGYGYGNGQFNQPSGIAVASDGSVYVADRLNNRIQKLDGAGNFVKTWGSGMPFSIAVDAVGAVYVPEGNVITIYDGNGKFIEQWGQYQEFNEIMGVAAASDGFVYVSDNNNSRIQKIDSNGIFVNEWLLNSDYQRGIATALDGSVFVTRRLDTPDCNSSVDKMDPFSGGSETLFEATIPIGQFAGSTQNYTTDAGILNATGQLYLNAKLTNSLGQTIALAEYPFSVVSGNTVISLNTDKKTYKPGETVIISGTVMNLSSTDALNLQLSMSSKMASGSSQTLYTDTFDLQSNGIHSFSTVTTAGTEGTVYVTVSVAQNGTVLAESINQYEVSAPKVAITMTGPDVTSKNPFTLDVTITNTGMSDANISYRVSKYDLIVRKTIDSNTLTIPAGEKITLQYAQQISATIYYRLDLSGDVVQFVQKTVFYGEGIAIAIGSGGALQNLGIYPEGTVSIPITVTNTGSVDESLSVTYQLLQGTGVPGQETRNYFLPKGGSTSDMLTYSLATGNYQLTAKSLLPFVSASKSFTVAKDPDVSMTATAGIQGVNGLIPITANITNSGYSSFSGSIAMAVMNNFGKTVWRGETQISNLASQASQDYIVNVTSAGMLPGAYSASVTLYSSTGQQLATNQTQVRVLGPIFEITSVPATPSFTVGKEATLVFGVKNTGTLAGSASLSVKAAELLNQSASNTFQPGEEKNYVFSFTVPEDEAPQAYLANYVLTPVQSQGTMGQTGFNIIGVNVGMTATLDKQIYTNGDTAVMNLTVAKQSQFQDGMYVALIRYGSYHDILPVTISSLPATLTFNVPLNAITGDRIFYGIYFQSGTRIAQSSLHINTAPIVTAASPAANGIYNSTLDIAAAVSDGGLGVGTVQYQVDGGQWSSLPLTDPSGGLYSTTWTPTPSDNGIHVVTFRATDSGGNMSLPVTISFTVQMDSTPPTGSITINNGAAYTNDPVVTLNLGCTDTESGCAQMQFSNDNSTWSASEAFAIAKAWSLSSGDGVKNVYVKYADGVGNLSDAFNVSIILDTIPPVAVITGTPASPTRDTGALLRALGSDVIAYKYQLDAGLISAEMNVSTPIALTNLAEGPHKVSVVGKDSAGNWQKEEYATSVSWMVDITPPVLTLSTLPNGAYTNNATMNISGMATDNIEVQGVNINDAAIPMNADGTFSQAISLITGSNIISTTAADTAGNTTTDIRMISLDQTAPVITITHPSDNSVTNEIATDVTGSVDKTATVRILVNGSSPMPASITDSMFSFPITYVYGQNTIEVSATDLAGNVGTAKRTAIYDNLSPALAITNPAQDITTNESSIMLQGTVADLTITAVTITCDGITFTPTVSAGSFEQQLTFIDEKTYSVVVTATDGAGNSSTVQRNIIYVKIPPPVTLYTFTGFFNPVDNPLVINTANAGQAIPIKWRLTDTNGSLVSDPASFKSLTSYLVDCASFAGDPADAIEEYASGSSGLLYVGDGNWHFNWKTPKTYAKQCRMMILTLVDNSTHTAHFEFK